jgi:hypothetical protein
MAPPTIIALKAGFLANQTRLLSQPLNPSRSWRNANEAADDGIPERQLDDALFRLNHALQQHTRRVYAPQATRHVAEQIDQLYWNAGEKVAEASREAGAEGLDAGLDMSMAPNDPCVTCQAPHMLTFTFKADSETINSLPATWEWERDVNEHPIEAKRYSELVGQLQALNAERARAEDNTLRLRHMSELLRPFQSDDEGRGVQENLITRDGEVEREMERMRMLLARVGARLGHLRERSELDSSGLNEGDAMLVDDVDVDEKRKVNDLLNNF